MEVSSPARFSGLEDSSVMHSSIRIFIEKKEGYSSKPEKTLHELKSLFPLPGLEAVRLVSFYEISGLPPGKEVQYAEEVLAEPPSDIFSLSFTSIDGCSIAAEYLPGQFDQRADSAQSCFSLLLKQEGTTVRSGLILDLIGHISTEEYKKIKNYWINPIEMREKNFSKVSLGGNYPPPEETEILNRFSDAEKERLKEIIAEYNLAMDISDLEYIRDYFTSSGRDPYLSELKVIDTYWSDHCRHTTFETEITDIEFPSSGIIKPFKEAWKLYQKAKNRVYGEHRPVTLMDLATIFGKDMRLSGNLEDLEVSEEINAASIKIKADTPEGEIDWLLMFKNETHNHPTELEPFGGASTCIGGAIRDPLSGRSYVYQAARITGSADPRPGAGKTPEGKLPQYYITTRAAAGYSSYGNQIGLATSFVKEIYDRGYAAKRMEVGAVVGGAPADHVVRQTPLPGDTVLVIGGATGRDGCGGATGSSKSHNKDSVNTAGSEVQKGNAPEERKLQRFFRNREAAVSIKRCNDFGAGGASVAIGELSPGVRIHLDKLPVKYKGLSATELAISESQERMAVVVSPEDTEKMIELAARENLTAVAAAEITADSRLEMEYGGKTIVDIERNFLDTSGVKRKTEVLIKEVKPEGNPFFSGTKKIKGKKFSDRLKKRFRELDISGEKGLTGMFDSTVGAGTVLIPLGGIYQETEAEASVHLLPLSETKTASVLSAGYNPVISRWSPFHGAVYAVTEALGRIAAAGGKWEESRFSFQEYFPSPGSDPELWGLPVSALLGGLWAQNAFGLPAVGGKDSMSGSFENLKVPPTLIAFGVTTANADTVISPEFKVPGNHVYLLKTPIDEDFLPDIEIIKDIFNTLEEHIGTQTIVSAWSLKEGGLAEGIAKMTFGNRYGASADLDAAGIDPFALYYGSFIVESSVPLEYPFAVKLGKVIPEWNLNIKQSGLLESIQAEDIFKIYSQPLSGVFPLHPEPSNGKGRQETAKETTSKSPKYKNNIHPSPSGAAPAVLIPVFFGTNGEYESSWAFEREGADTETLVFRNRSTEEINRSIENLSRKIRESQILFLPGGFSAGDEPDGSGKFIVSVLKNPEVSEAVETLLKDGGLILGICNGFQALIKSGLLPYGKIGAVNSSSPTLIANTSGRHISTIAPTRYTGAKSPWLDDFFEGEIHHLPFSHGEGRFKASKTVLEDLFKNGQVAFQYADLSGNPLEGEKTINGSDGGVEGLISPDGRILGKMGHSERYRRLLYKNYPGFRHQNIFASGVKYFKRRR